VKTLNPLAVLLLAGLISLAVSCGTTTRTEAEILWDVWGVPHIFADSNEGLYFAFGWAQMHNHGDLILRLYGEARGRAAEYWGDSLLKQDVALHTAGLPEIAAIWLQAQDPEVQGWLQSFSDGMNAYVEAHPEAVSREVQAVLPVQPIDVLAHAIRVLHFTFVGGSAFRTGHNWTNAGSNAWAISPSRTVSGNSMLLLNPHLPWSGFFLWMESQLSVPGLNASGATLVGMPFLAIGFNDHLGWTHTVNTFDGMDLYELTLEGEGYKWDGAVREFDRSSKVLRVKQPDGAFREQEISIEHSVHGPVIARKHGKALALRVVGLDQPHLIQQYWDMSRAQTLAEFESAISRLQMPMFNTIYADREGHIMYLYGGRVPRRPSGDWNFWRGIIPGQTSETLWTETLEYDELPRLIDPKTGWVQNANDSPWTSTIPQVLNPKDFPAYLAPNVMPFRPQRSARMLVEDAQISFEELIKYKHSTRAEAADRLLDDLVDAVTEYGTDKGKEAVEVLKRWDRKTEAESEGAVLFALWAGKLGWEDFAVAWSEEAPLTTPDGLADPEEAVKKFEAAASELELKYGRLDIPWGEVVRLRYADKDLPANGGPSDWGIFRQIAIAEDEDGKSKVVAGESYYAAVEFGPELRAEALLSYGNATQPGSPHHGDQLELFAKKQLRPVWRTRQEIEANLEKREVVPFPNLENTKD
jgi:acyl-homoserine-lactone acylase